MLAPAAKLKSPLTLKFKTAERVILSAECASTAPGSARIERKPSGAAPACWNAPPLRTLSVAPDMERLPRTSRALFWTSMGELAPKDRLEAVRFSREPVLTRSAEFAPRDRPLAVTVAAPMMDREFMLTALAASKPTMEFPRPTAAKESDAPGTGVRDWAGALGPPTTRL